MAKKNLTRHQKIKVAMVERGTTFIDVARKLEVNRSVVSAVSKGVYYNELVAQCLAEAAGLDFEKLWPEHSTKASVFKESEGLCQETRK